MGQNKVVSITVVSLKLRATTAVGQDVLIRGVLINKIIRGVLREGFH